MIVVPEIVIKNLLEKGIQFVRNDYANTPDKEKTLLYRLFNGVSLGAYDFYRQLVEILSRNQTDPRHLEVNYFFNGERAKYPTIHITLPNENPYADGLGIDAGAEDPIPANLDFDEITIYNRNFRCTYNIVITSENSLEVIALYHFLRSLMISLFIDLENSLLSNPKLSGGDISMLSDLIPTNIFMRNIGLEFNYNVAALSLKEIPSFGTLIFQETVLTEEDESSSS